MPAHDWTRVTAGTFHAFHTVWIGDLQKALNGGLLPEGYYALAEQQAQDVVPDVLTLSRGAAADPGAETQGTLVLDEAPPQVSVHMEADEATSYRAARRTLTIRHRSSRQIVAMIEVVSEGNKDREQHVEQFVDKAVAALQQGIHLLVVDLYPPGTWDPHGLHGAIWPIVGGGDFELPEDKSLTLAAYLAERLPQAFVEPIAVGQSMPDMPLFLCERRYIQVPLESTYMSAYAGLPAFVKDILEGRAPAETP